MNSTSILRAALLSLVAASLGTWAVRTFRDTPVAEPATHEPAAPKPALIADGVAVVNFHGSVRCPTCLGIGSLSQAVVAEEFAGAIDEGRLAWSSIDFDEPGNTHYKDDYDLYSSNVVIVWREHGADVGWKGLDDVWTHYGDEPAFRAYVRAAVSEALARQER